MNIVSWENGDVTITDYPDCSNRFLSKLVQNVNDSLADDDGHLSPQNSLIALELGHATVGTTNHTLTDLELRVVYVRCAVFAARKVVHLDSTGTALPAIKAAEAWADNPSSKTAANTANAAAYAAANTANAAANTANAAAYAAAYAAANTANAAAYAANAAAYAAANTANAAAYAAEIIDLFKTLTGTHSPTPDPQKTACAVEKMLVAV
jgi:hypothetical protein